MATYPVIQGPTLPTVAGKTITNVDSNGLNPIANMVIRMLEKCDNEFADALSASTSTARYNMIIPYGFVASEYDNKVYFGYDNSSPTRALQVNVNTNQFIRQMQNLRFIEYRDGDVVTLEPQSQADAGQALASPLYTGTELFYYNFSATEENVTPFFAEPYSSTQRVPKLYRGQPGSRALVNSSIRSMYLILKFRGFKTCHIMDGEYMHTPTLIEGDVYLYVNIPSLFYRLGGAVYNYMDDPEITKSFFDNDIKVICSVPPAVGYPQILTPPRMMKADLDKLFNTIAIPFTYDPAQVQNETFTDGYDPNFVYVEKGGEEPEPPDGETGQPNDVTGGGDGNGDNTSNEFEASKGYNPLFPSSKQYVLDAQDVDLFQSYLWDPSAWQSIQELWGDAWGAIISLKYYPFSLLAHDSSNLGEKETIKIGKVSLSSIGNISEPAQGIPMKPSYNCRFDLGEFKFEEYFGTFMDYEPYTSISIFLPFIGWRDIGANDVMGKVLKVHYIVDFNTGNCTAYLTVDNGTNEFLYNQYQGTIGVDLPLSKNDFQQKMLSMGVGIMSASLTAAVQANGLKTTSSSLSQSSSNSRGASDVITNSANKRIGGSAILGSGRTISLNNSYNQSQSYMASNRSSSNESITKTDPTLSIVNGISGATANFVRPVSVTTTGTVGASDSLWISRKPIIRIERPIKSEASSFEENQGRPANITKKLADMTGYVECLNPVINFKCNESERAEIAALLQGGIYL